MRLRIRIVRCIGSMVVHHGRRRAIRKTTTVRPHANLQEREKIYTQIGTYMLGIQKDGGSVTTPHCNQPNIILGQ